MKVIEMNRLFPIVLICYISFISFVIIDLGNANETSNKTHTRQRRYLSFKNSTKFFMRLNFKANMVPWNQLFAQALGFRMNWDEPPDTFRPYHRLFRRTAYKHLETLLDKNGMNGYHCVRRAICEMALDENPRSLYNKILKMIFSRESKDNNKWIQDITKENCLQSMNLCHFSFKDVSTYTDI